MVAVERGKVRGEIRAMVLKLGQFCSGDIWQCLEILLVVTPGEEGATQCQYPVGRGQRCCRTSYNAQHSPVGLRLKKCKLGGKKRHHGGDRGLRQTLQCALCWESGDSGSTQRIMMMMMTMVIPFVHTAVDNGVSHSFPP